MEQGHSDLQFPPILEIRLQLMIIFIIDFSAVRSVKYLKIASKCLLFFDLQSKTKTFIIYDDLKQREVATLRIKGAGITNLVNFCLNCK